MMALDENETLTEVLGDKQAGSYELVMLPLDQIKVDHAYYRPVSDRRLEEMAEEGFQDSLAEALVCNMRDSGDVYLMSGQHRLLAARAAGRTELPVKLFFGLSRDEEIRAYDRMNWARAKSQPVDRLRAHYERGEHAAVRLVELLDEYGYTPFKSNVSDNSFRAVAFAMAAFERDSEVLRVVLQLMSTTWRGKPGATERDLARGMELFIARHRSEYQYDKLARVIEAYLPKQLAAAGHSLSLSMRIAKPEGMYRFLLQEYNKKVAATKKLALQEEHSHSKLTADQVREMLTLYLAEPGKQKYVRVRDLARRFGVDEQTARDVIDGKSWRHIYADVMKKSGAKP